MPDDISSDSEDGGEHHHRVPVTLPVSRVGISSCSQTTPPITPLAYAPKDIMDSSYLVKRMSQSNGTIFYQKGGGLASTARGLKRSPTGNYLPIGEIWEHMLNYFLKFHDLICLHYLHDRRCITRRHQLRSEWKWIVIIDGNQEWQQRKLAQPAYEIYNRVDICYRIVKLFILLFTVSGVSNRFTSKTGKKASMHSNRNTKIVCTYIRNTSHFENEKY